MKNQTKKCSQFYQEKKQIKNNWMAVTQSIGSAAQTLWLQFCGGAIQSANYMVTMVSVSVGVSLCNSLSRVHKDKPVTRKAIYKKVALSTPCLYARAELNH